VSKAVPTAFDEDALLQAGIEAAQSNANLAENARDELPLGERALASANRKVTEIEDERHKRFPRLPWVSAVRCTKW
jgi:hypothetical protein